MIPKLTSSVTATSWGRWSMCQGQLRCRRKQDGNDVGLPLTTVYRRLPPSENEKRTNNGSDELMDGQSLQSGKPIFAVFSGSGRVLVAFVAHHMTGACMNRLDGLEHAFERKVDPHQTGLPTCGPFSCHHLSRAHFPSRHRRVF